MSKIQSRPTDDQWATNTTKTQAYHDFVSGYKAEFDAEWAQLINRLDDFLEVRIKAEFDELRADIALTSNLNRVLMEENLRLAAQRDSLQGVLERMDEQEKAAYFRAMIARRVA